MMSDRERSVAGNWLHEKIFRTEKLSDLLALSPCIEAGKCPHDRTNGDKNDKHCACQQQNGCVYHSRRVIAERRCRFPKHHSTKRNHQRSFQQGNPTKNGILAKQIIKADKGNSILPTVVAKRNPHKQKFRQKADKQHHFLAYKDINSIHPYIEPGSAGAIKGQ